ncbi:HAMP domain-containing sensor histidine kinase [Eubacterium sp. 1001713B170207_170306_E7]|uniref:sensor histidine kinase n=1 Tax=Eubacterium sp. 1001713B170207_170306_E7 TaxID=2787097 RepID=UPI001899B216|nr:HAMP domain-containing sensor histidine kinase [Eubacterium sp. 1001713B170207_170306_E7]
MRHYRLLIFAVFFAGMAAVILLALEARRSFEQSSREYLIEINRLTDALSADEGAISTMLPQMKRVKTCDWLPEGADEQETASFFTGAGMNGDYKIMPVYRDGVLAGYARFTYTPEQSSLYRLLKTAVVCMALLTLIALSALIYVGQKILKPFNRASSLPEALAKGKLSEGLKEEKNRYFGRFIWGLDMLRETLGDERQKRLKLERDRKTLVASLSHNIRTPLAAIRLYASALYTHLYQTPEKQDECARLIEAKVVQIEGLVDEIIKSSSEAISEAEICNRDFYVGDFMKGLGDGLHRQMEQRHILFKMICDENRLVYGDPERLTEVIENIVENAVKYGDGREIQIKCAQEEGHELIRIQNSGRPVRENEITSLFNSFWRGSNVQGQTGNGLGLYISRTYLRQMEGELTAEILENGMAFTLILKIS